MKNRDKQNFTKLTQKKGISLIVLIVTIIVIIILAAVVILTISKNNPVESAREARFKEDIRSFQDDLALTVSKEYTDLQGQRDEKVSGTTYDEIVKYIPSFTKEYEGKLAIQNDELVYQETVTEKEKEWFEALGIKVRPIDAQTVAESPTEYYGKSITNYDVNGVKDWKIFHSDGSNVYIIASDYVDVSKLPANSAGNKPANTNSNYPKAAPFTNIINDYTGSADIIDEKIKALNSDYFSKGYTSTNTNMKAVAYMLDTGIWSSFANEKTEYVIGGPTIEIFMASYNKTHDKEYKAQASNNTGYQISKDGGVNWANWYSEILNTNDILYVLPSSKGANAIWLASPAAVNTSNAVVYATCKGNVGNYGDEGITDIGFRPLVCLKSNVTLKAVENGVEIQ